MRRVTMMFLCMLGCSSEPGDDSTTSTTPTTVPMCPAPMGCDEGSTAANTDPTSGAGPTSEPDTGNVTTGPASSSSSGPGTSVPVTTGSTGADETTMGEVDCAAPPDCASCWTCARNGPCKAAYDACAFEAFCSPTLACFESMCNPDGLQQSCADTCCMSCKNLGTCPGVEGALACITPMCAGLCGMVTCG
jgi:hypothetical protein